MEQPAEKGGTRDPAVALGGSVGEPRSSLYRRLEGGPGGMGGASLRWRNSFGGPQQGARDYAAPAGAKGRLVDSMCQIASASRRARSTWATLGPRWRPSRVLVRR